MRTTGSEQFMGKRALLRWFLSFILSFCLAFSLLPTTALADETERTVEHSDSSAGDEEAIDTDTGESANESNDGSTATEPTASIEDTPAENAPTGYLDYADTQLEEASSSAVSIDDAAASSNDISPYSEEPAFLSSLGQIDGVYQIESADDLKTFRDSINNGTIASDADAVLIASVDVSDSSWAPIGTSSTPYTGTFDGAGKTITYALSSTSAWQGFFREIGAAGVVRNLNVTGTATLGNSSGAIAGNNLGTIQGCTSSVTISTTSARQTIGGIAGVNSGSIISCTNTGNITGGYNVGGIAGKLSSGSITGCANSGNIGAIATSVNSCAGGIVGIIEIGSKSTSLTITDTHNSGIVTAGSGSAWGCAGGIVGRENNSTSNYEYGSFIIANCSNIGTVTGAEVTGDYIAKYKDAQTILDTTGGEPVPGEYRFQIIIRTGSTGPEDPEDIAVTAAEIAGYALVGETLTAMARGADEREPTDPVFQWQISDDGVTYTAVDGATQSTLLLDAAYAGKWIRVHITGSGASSVDSTALGPIVAATESVWLSKVELSGEAKVGQKLTAIAYTEVDDDWGWPEEETVTEGVIYSWSYADSVDGPSTAIEGVTSATYTIPLILVGKYLKVVAYAGQAGNEVSATSGAVLNAGSIEDEVYVAAAKQALESNWWKPSLVYGVDSNINIVTQEALSRLGYGDITVRVLTSDKPTTISPSDDAENGAIDYFYIDPDQNTTYKKFESVSTVLCLSRGSAEIALNKNVVVPWNVDKVKAVMQERAVSAVTDTTLSAEELSAVTQNLTLPKYLGGKNGLMWTSITWKSSDTSALEILPNQGTSIDDQIYGPSVGKVKRGVDDTTVTLTATFTFRDTYGDEPPITLQKTFTVTVKGQGEELRQAMQQELDENYTADKLTYSGTDQVIDTTGVCNDIQLLIPRNTGITNYADYRFSVTSSTDAIVVNGYRAVVYRPLPEATPSSATFTVTMEHRDSGITVSKTIPLTVAPLTQSEIDAEIVLMEQAKASFFEGIRNTNTTESSITDDLHAFQEVRWNDEGTALEWVYDYSATTGNGIIPDELEGWEGQEQWRLFKSSNAGIITHENLQVTVPEYNKTVTIESCLTSETYGKYALKYPDNTDFQKLYRQAVSAQLAVIGTKGEDPDPVAETIVTCSVTGIQDIDGESTKVLWLPQMECIADEGATAWDVTKSLLDREGYTYEYNGILSSITNPDGTTLATGQNSDGSWNYWSLEINGEYAQVGADAYYPVHGDVISWVYIDGTGGTKEPTDPGIVVDPDAPRPDYGSSWPNFTGSRFTEADTPTSAAGTGLSWKYALLGTADFGPVSEPIIANDSIYIAANRTLALIDPATGKAGLTAELATSIDYTCRPLYAEGVIIVPLSGGRLQALTADTLTTVWITDTLTADAVYGAQQSITTLTYDEGYVYMGTALADWSGSYGGTYQCVNVKTGAIRWRTTNTTAGYYWSGGITIDDLFLYAGDDGNLVAVDKKTGIQKATLSLGVGVRSTLVTDGTYVFVVTRDGYLYRIPVDTTAEGEALFGSPTALSFAASSTSTPTLHAGKLFVGGAQADGTGVLAVIDSTDMEVIYRIQTPADVKSAPVVCEKDGAVYAYFTCNTEPGGVYIYKLGDSHATELYVPIATDANYCMASLTVGADGTLYYTNDSGNLFALTAKTPDDPDVPKIPDTPENPGIGTSENHTSENQGTPAGSSRTGRTLTTVDATTGGNRETTTDETGDSSEELVEATSLVSKDTNAADGAEADESPAETVSPYNWLPLVGMGVGGLGLLGVLAWLLYRRRGFHPMSTPETAAAPYAAPDVAPEEKPHDK